MLVAASCACVALVTGSIALAALRLPIRSVPPAFAEDPPLDDASALAVPNMPSNGRDMPTPVPSCSSRWRLMRPAMYSSM